MKPKLKRHFFEEIEIRLPLFPGLASEATPLGRPRGSYTLYTNKHNKNLLAFRWTIDLRPRKKARESSFSVRAVIVGIFEFPRAPWPRAKKKSYLVRYAPEILYEVLRRRLSPITKNSMLKDFDLPQIDFPRVRYK
jgi:preprotein translocase subunit SecB